MLMKLTPGWVDVVLAVYNEFLPKPLIISLQNGTLTWYFKFDNRTMKLTTLFRDQMKVIYFYLSIKQLKHQLIERILFVRKFSRFLNQGGYIHHRHLPFDFFVTREHYDKILRTLLFVLSENTVITNTVITNTVMTKIFFTSRSAFLNHRDSRCF